MKNLAFLLCFTFISSCFHEKIYSCSSPRQSDVFIELKNKKFYFKFSGKSKFESIPVLINNKMEVVAQKKYKYTKSNWRYTLNKIENKLIVRNIRQRGKSNTWNYKCIKK